MIKAIILDVDGVIVGEKKGYNFPVPHPKVISRLKKVNQDGTPIILCTAKPYYAVEKIIDSAKLSNLHITLAGGVIIDPINTVVVKKHTLPPKIVQHIIQTYIKNDVYVEIYAVDKYFVQADQVYEFTQRRIEVLQKEPVIVESLLEASVGQDIVKILVASEDKEDQVRLAKLFVPFKNDLTITWTDHPFTVPHQYGNITAQGISKKQAVSIVANSLNVQSQDMLGVGDGLGDWQFMELCGYAASMGNTSEELKQLVRAKGTHGYVGNSVDVHGILDVLDHFGVK